MIDIMESRNLFFDELDFKASPDLCRNPKCTEDREELFERRAERRFALQVYLCFLCHFENKYRGAMRRHFRETHSMVMIKGAPNKRPDAGVIGEQKLKVSLETEDSLYDATDGAHFLNYTKPNEAATDEASQKINIVQLNSLVQKRGN